jgi:molybdenum cofactor synthesis domain-containing protein
MISVSKAIQIIARETKTRGAEKIDLHNAVGRVLREDIVADTDLPPFDRSQMDGFAVVAADTQKAAVTLQIVGESAAGRGWHKTMKRGQAVRIMTGAPLPKGADSVQKIELTNEHDNGEVALQASTEKGRFIVRKGSEIKSGQTVFRAGEIITDTNIASLAAFGYAKVKVSKKPRIAILGTGSEIVPIDKRPGRDQIRNSNSVMLSSLARKFGAETTVFPISKDEISNLKFQISNAAKHADILVITGGVSVGKYDLTKTVLAGLGAHVFFDKVRLKPGKPAVFAGLGRTLVFGLPGNPVSAAVTFHLFVRKCILAMKAASAADLRQGFAVLVADARAARERDTYLPSQLETNRLGQLLARPLKWQGSSDFIGYARADSMIYVPRGQQLAKGDVARIVFL